MTVESTRLFDDVDESMRGIKIIDVDTHLTEPADIWTSRAPERLRKRVPHVVLAKDLTDGMRAQVAKLGTTGPTDGAPMWVVDETQVLGPAGAGSVINRNNEKVKGSVFLQWPLDESSLAASYVEPRVAMMDQLGISAQIVFPNVVGFGGQNFFRISDHDLRMDIVRIWNDAMADMQKESGGRLFGMALLPWWDIDKTVAEIKRVAELGLKGIITNADPQNQGMPDLAESFWDPMWQHLQDLDLPVNFHCGASATQRTYNGGSPWPSMTQNSKLAVGSAMLQMGNARLVANMILSGVCERFPRLKAVSVESGIGWLPFMLEALDYHADENAADGLTLKPSEYFRRQMYACFWFENGPSLIDSIERLGVDNCMFETDFPHPTCLFPEPLRSAVPTFKDAGESLRRKVFSENAAHVYNLDLAAL
ncbi:putative TIM-barrel fold metal-dependent hydrolase [Nocardia sp. GAS34]|uniref:amidohydrolase family protein n=1 Tax=unclassified Nocardia TaxID=2637762 RepID=UPI003D1F7B2E